MSLLTNQMMRICRYHSTIHHTIRTFCYNVTLCAGQQYVCIVYVTDLCLKGNTTAIFNKNMLESMSIQILPTYCFCCTILLIIKINYLCSPLLVSIFCVGRLTRHSNWIKVYVKPAARHAQCKILVENFNFLLNNFLFF